MTAIPRKQTGFTIVELLVVIVVIGILAAITIVAYNGVQQRAADAVLRSDLANAAEEMSLACADAVVCPTSFPSSVKVSPDVGLSLSKTSKNTTYCINGSHAKYSDMRLYDEQGKGIQDGTCSGAVIAGSETGSAPKNLVLSTDFSSNWNWQRANGNSVSATSRAGMSGDPNPNRPVLVVANNPVAAGWSYLSGPISTGDIHAGQQYKLSVWVRRTAGSTPTQVNSVSAMNGDTANKSLIFGGGAIGTSWTQITQTATAVANGVSGNVFYVSLNGDVTQSWTMELQEPSVTPVQ